MKDELLDLYTRCLLLSRQNNQVVGKKRDYYVTMEQLENIVKLLKENL